MSLKEALETADLGIYVPKRQNEPTFKTTKMTLT